MISYNYDFVRVLCNSHALLGPICFHSSSVIGDLIKYMAVTANVCDNQAKKSLWKWLTFSGGALMNFRCRASGRVWSAEPPTAVHCAETAHQ
jgi:hypothetical protein